MTYEDVFYQSKDGLTLYARDYCLADSDLAVLCMHGLTRNAADFASLAEHLAARYRVIAVDQRGRGRSAYDSDPARYNPAVYVEDMECLLETLHIAPENVLLIGTSMGGLMSMMLSARHPGEFRGIILNDIGPVVDPAGLERIKSYVGRSTPVQSWAEAVEQCREINAQAFPDFDAEQWLEFARALYRENADGIPELAYDPAISQPIAEAQEAAVPPDLWPLFDTTHAVPLLLIRGALSDILSADCAREMRERHPDCRYLELPNRGHAPTLSEATSVEAIMEFIEYCSSN